MSTTREKRAGNADHGIILLMPLTAPETRLFQAWRAHFEDEAGTDCEVAKERLLFLLHGDAMVDEMQHEVDPANPTNAIDRELHAAVHAYREEGVRRSRSRSRSHTRE